MKKSVCLLLGLFILISLLACPAVLAEPDEDPDTGTTAIDQSDSTTTAEPTPDTTAPDPVPTTTTRRHTSTTTTAHKNGAVVKTNMVIMVMNEKIAARVTDELGAPVAGVSVGLQLGTTVMPPVVTDASGYAQFPYVFPSDDIYVYCSSNQVVIDGVTYTAAAASVGSAPSRNSTTARLTTTGSSVAGTTTRSRKTTRTTSTKKTTEAAALTFFTGAGTTGIEETMVTLNFCFDSGILKSFGVDEKDFADTARLLMTPENYAAMVSNMNGSLMLAATTSTTEVTDEQIAASLANDPMLSRADLTKTQRLMMNLSPRFTDAATGKVTELWNIPEGTYVIQLPIPKEMRGTQSITVSAITADGVSEPIVAYVSKDGFLRFQTSSPAGTILLLGFENSMLGTLTNHAARFTLIFLLLGVACISGAVFLFFRFVRSPKEQKTAKKKEEPAAELPAEEPEMPDDELPPVGENNARIDLDGGLDIFAESETHTPREKNPSDYDIPL